MLNVLLNLLQYFTYKSKRTDSSPLTSKHSEFLLIKICHFSEFFNADKQYAVLFPL